MTNECYKRQITRNAAKRRIPAHPSPRFQCPSGARCGTVVVNSAGLNVRQSPNGALLNYRLFNGANVEILDEAFAANFNWYRVRDEQGRTGGWVRADFVEITSTSPSIGRSGTVVVNSAGLNVRYAPDGVLFNFRLENGTNVQILEEAATASHNWYLVKNSLGQTYGWVRADFVRLDSI